MDNWQAGGVGFLIGLVLVTASGVAVMWGFNDPPTIYTGTVHGAIYDNNTHMVIVQVGDHVIHCALGQLSVQQRYSLPYNMTSLAPGSNATIIQDHWGNCVRA